MQQDVRYWLQRNGEKRMKELNILWFLVVLAPSLFGQTAQTKAVTRPDDKQLRETTAAKSIISPATFQNRFCVSSLVTRTSTPL